MKQYQDFFSEHKVVLILPYFGKLPNYFPLWQKSASYNENIRFLVIGDQLPLSSDYQNIRFMKTSFLEMTSLISQKLPCKCRVKTPYKLCDFKPAYGLIFSDYIKEYAYWGYCDPDIIWGEKLEQYLFRAISSGADKINQYGHLTLYRNTPEINTRFMQRSDAERVTFRDVYAMDYVAHFDEGYIIQDLFKDHPQYNYIEFADISYWTHEFRLSTSNGHKNEPQLYRWKDGKLCGYYLTKEQIDEAEIIYLHLQKRKMQVQVDEKANDFLIVPNAFINGENVAITAKMIEQNALPDRVYERSFRKRRYKTIVEHCLTGAIRYRMINYFRKNE